MLVQNAILLLVAGSDRTRVVALVQDASTVVQADLTGTIADHIYGRAVDVHRARRDRHLLDRICDQRFHARARRHGTDRVGADAHAARHLADASDRVRVQGHRTRNVADIADVAGHSDADGP